MKNLMMYSPHKMLFGDQIKADEIDLVHMMCRRKEKFI